MDGADIWVADGRPEHTRHLLVYSYCATLPACCWAARRLRCSPSWLGLPHFWCTPGMAGPTLLPATYSYLPGLSDTAGRTAPTWTTMRQPPTRRARCGLCSGRRSITAGSGSCLGRWSQLHCLAPRPAPAWLLHTCKHAADGPQQFALYALHIAVLQVGGMQSGVPVATLDAAYVKATNQLTDKARGCFKLHVAATAAGDAAAVSCRCFRAAAATASALPRWGCCPSRCFGCCRCCAVQLLPLPEKRQPSPCDSAKQVRTF